MRKAFRILLIPFLAVLFAACSSNTGNTGGSSSGMASSQSSVSTQEPQVSMENFSFNPEVLTVPKGTTVVWTNNDSAVHNVEADDFNSPDLKKGETFAFTFEKTGTYDYICGLHPKMTGQIVVTEK